MKDVLKAILWGLSLLISVVYIVFMSVLIWVNLTQRPWVNQQRALKLVPEVRRIVEDLSSKYPGEENKQQWSLFGDYNSGLGTAFNNANDEVDHLVEGVFSTGQYKNRYYYMSPKEKLDLIVCLASDKYSLGQYNSTNLKSSVYAIFGVVLFGFFVYRLIGHSKYSVISNLLLVIYLVPFVVMITLLAVKSVLGIADGFDYNSFVITLLFSVLWLFLVYPPAIMYSKKRGGVLAVLFK